MQSIAKFLVILLSLLLSTAIWSDSSESLLSQAHEAESQGQYSTSLIHLRNAVAESPDNLEVRLELVKMIVLTGQGKQAKVELEKAEKLGAKPDQTTLLMLRSQFYLGLYDEIIDLSSLINLPLQQIGQIRAMQGFAFAEQRKFDQTRQMFERALSLSPKVMESQLGQVKLLNFQGKESEELKLVNQLLKQYPDHPEVLMVAATSYLTHGQYDKALKLFEQAGRIQHANINVWFGIIRSYIGLNDLNNAKSEIQKILSSYPEHQVTNYLLAVIAFQENDYTRAKSAIDIVLKGKKRKFEALKLLGKIQFHQQDYTQAEKGYKQLQLWVKKYPDALPLAEVLAYPCHFRNELNKARNHYEKIIEKTPNNDRIINRLAFVAMEQGSPMSLEYADLTYNLNTKNSAKMDTLGLERLNNRNIPKALAILKKASQFEPADPDLRYHYV